MRGSWQRGGGGVDPGRMGSQQSRTVGRPPASVASQPSEEFSVKGAAKRHGLSTGSRTPEAHSSHQPNYSRGSPEYDDYRLPATAHSPSSVRHPSKRYRERSISPSFRSEPIHQRLGDSRNQSGRQSDMSPKRRRLSDSPRSPVESRHNDVARGAAKFSNMTWTRPRDDLLKSGIPKTNASKPEVLRPEMPRADVNGVRDVPTGPSAQFYPPVGAEVKNLPHIFVSAEHVPVIPSRIKNLRGMLKRYKPRGVFVDDNGYYITFDDSSTGRLWLDLCKKGSNGWRLFGQYPVHMECFRHDTAEEPRRGSICPAAGSSREAPQAVQHSDPLLGESSAGNLTALNRAAKAQSEEIQPTSAARIFDHEHAEVINDLTNRPANPTDLLPSSQAEKDDTSSSILSSASGSGMRSCHVCKVRAEDLVKCTTCPRRYHRYCHTPKAISDDASLMTWQCTRCQRKGIPAIQIPVETGPTVQEESRVADVLHQSEQSNLAEIEQQEDPARGDQFDHLAGSQRHQPEVAAPDHEASAADDLVERSFVDEEAPVQIEAPPKKSLFTRKKIAPATPQQSDPIPDTPITKLSDLVGSPKDVWAASPVDSVLQAPQQRKPRPKPRPKVIECSQCHSKMAMHPSGRTTCAKCTQSNALHQAQHVVPSLQDTDEKFGDKTSRLATVETIAPPEQPSPPAGQAQEVSGSTPRSPIEAPPQAESRLPDTEHVSAVPEDESSKHEISEVVEALVPENDTVLNEITSAVQAAAPHDDSTQHEPPDGVENVVMQEDIAEVEPTKYSEAVSPPGQEVRQDDAPTIEAVVTANSAHVQDSASLHAPQDEAATNLQPSKTPHSTSTMDPDRLLASMSQPYEGMSDDSDEDDVPLMTLFGENEPASQRRTSKKALTRMFVGSPDDDQASSEPLQKKIKRGSYLRKKGHYYDLGSSNDIPKGTYLRLIQMALCDAPNKRMQARDVPKWVAKNVPNWSPKDPVWQSSIQATMTLNNQGKTGKPMTQRVPWEEGDGGHPGSDWFSLLPGIVDKLEHWDHSLKRIIPPKDKRWMSEVNRKFLAAAEAAGGDAVIGENNKVKGIETSAEDTADRSRNAMDVGPAGPNPDPSGQVDSPEDAMDVDSPLTERAIGDLPQLAVEVDDAIDTEADDTSIDEPIAARKSVQRAPVATMMSPERPAVFSPLTRPDSPEPTQPKAPVIKKPRLTLKGPRKPSENRGNLAVNPTTDPEKDEVYMLHRIRQEAKAHQSQKTTFAEIWPQYVESNRLDTAAKIKEIQARPTRKQLWGKPPVIQPSTEATPRSPIRVEKDRRGNRDDPNDPLNKLMPCNSLDEFFGIKDSQSLVPVLVDKQLAFRSADLRSRKVYKLGI